MQSDNSCIRRLGASLETKFSQTGRGATRGLSTGNRHTQYGKHRIAHGWCGSHNPDWAKTRGRMKLAADLSLDKEMLKTHAYGERARSTLTDSGYEKTEVKVPRVFKFLDMAGSVLHTIDDPEDQLPIPVYRQEITIGSDRMRVESVTVRSTGPQTCYVCVQTKAPKD